MGTESKDGRARPGSTARERGEAAARSRASSIACCSSGRRPAIACCRSVPSASAIPVVVVGTLPPAEPGELIRAEGAWYDDRSWGRQFRATAATLEAPASEAGLVAYLGLRPDQGRGRGAGAAAGRRSSACSLGEVIEHEPLRLRDVEGVGPEAREPAAGGLAGPAPGARHAGVPGRAGLQPDARQPDPRGLWPGRDRDHQPRPLRPRPRHPRHRLRHRRRDRAQAGRGPGFGAADRCRHGRGAARGRRRRATPPCRWPTRGIGWASCSTPTPAVVDDGDRARAAGRAAGRARPTRPSAI